jgi:ketosteroid isomerase-like protein
MPRRRHALIALASTSAATAATAQPAPAPATPGSGNFSGPDAQGLRASEQAFADSMARRDFAAFSSHVADDAVFATSTRVLRGKAEVLAFWQGFFAGPAAPFAWRPDLVNVLDDGKLGYSTGPVSDPSGRVTARFHSTWRRESDGRWRVIFDNGQPACPPPPPAG